MLTVYDRMYGNFPANINVYTPYICMYVCMVLANPTHMSSTPPFVQICVTVTIS